MSKMWDNDILALATGAQRSALAPHASVWVSANAGTGKTEVLTRRMMALLLHDLNLLPREIVALTFTKAGAAEMVERLPKTLHAWLKLDVAAMVAKARDELGLAVDETVAARVAFLADEVKRAPVVATTIHGLAQQVVGRYPLEAGVPVGFDVLEDDGQRVLLREAMQHLLQHEGWWSTHLGILLDEIGEHGWGELSSLMMREWRRVDEVLKASGGHEALLDNTRRGLGLTGEETFERIAPTAEEWAALKVIAEVDFDKVRKVLQATPAQLEQAYVTLLLSEDAPRKRDIVNKALQKKTGGEVVELMHAAAARVAEQVRVRKLLRSWDVTQAAVVWGSAVRGEYERMKTENGVLDFDDLLHALERLLEREDVLAWLEQRFKHVLLDEGQDNNPQQDRMVRMLARNVLSGGGDSVRSVLAVGDVKQSIFRFQGAVPELFLGVGQELAAWGEERFRKVDLTHNFRSGRHVLAAVDAVFEGGVAQEVQGEDRAWPTHMPVAGARASRVEVWPLVVPLSKAKLEPWPLPWDRAAASGDRAEVSCLKQVGAWIQDMLARGVVLPGHDRPVRPEDFMVLVQRNDRAAVVAGVLRAMGLPVAAGGLVPMVVQDVVALLRVVFNPYDRVALAQVLKGLRGRSDAVLIEISALAGRGEWRGVLSAEDDGWLKGFEALRFGPPLALVQRAVAEVGFGVHFETLLDWAEKAATLRDLVARLERENLRAVPESGGVRVLTVHGAKGLQAPVVVMTDTMGALDSVQRDKLLFGAGVMVFKGAGGVSELEDTLVAEEKVRKRADALRGLYVAMTRAEDVLVVAGWGKEDGESDTWWRLVRGSADLTRGWREENGKWILGEDLW